MTIFDFLKSILYSKQKIELNCDDESQFNLFMVNRWCSFYSKEINNYINETGNRYGSIMQLKQEQYDFLFHIVPQLRFKKIDYIKKTKKESVEEAIILPEFISNREYKNYVEFEKTIAK